jgi:hypothetical protein
LEHKVAMGLRQRWSRGCVVLLAALLVAVIVACSLGVIGLQRGAVAPLRFDWNLSSLRLVGYSTWNANCPPFVGCDPTLHEAYVIWLIVEQPDPDAARRSARRLVTLPIEHVP